MEVLKNFAEDGLMRKLKKKHLKYVVTLSTLKIFIPLEILSVKMENKCCVYSVGNNQLQYFLSDTLFKKLNSKQSQTNC